MSMERSSNEISLLSQLLFNAQEVQEHLQNLLLMLHLCRHVA
jgi:hypothetical protein